jgi:hypothetical protein
MPPRRRPSAPGPRPPKPAPPAYYALVVPGLESLAAAELTVAGATVRDTLSRIDRRDSVIIFSAPDLTPILRCGLLEDLFQIVLDAPTPDARGAPKVLARAMERAPLERALLAHNGVRPKNLARTYKIVARVAGKHPFHRDDVDAPFIAAMAAMLPRWAPSGGLAAIELWVHVIGERTIAGLRLSGDEMAQRRYKHAHLPASLKPTVARALVMLSEPQKGDVCLDPMAGAGTILRERAEAERAALIIGGDIDLDALKAARRNTGKQAALSCWDATRLPLAQGSVDAVVTNPPYGRQMGTVAGLDRLYARSLREMARVLRPGGRCVVLTAEAAVLMRTMPPTLTMRSKHRIMLRGLATTAFVMVRA